MRLFEAILNANHQAVSGDARAGLHPSEFPDSLPIVALSCIDPRLNRLLPEVLGIREEDFIWLRNAGNIIFDPLSSMMRTLALACAIKGGKEIAIIGHTDCRVRQVSVNQLIESFRALGIQRSSLPDNLVEFFGLFASERQNVLKGVSHTRHSPLISPKVPVHGLLVDIQTGQLEWLVNGYEQAATTAAPPPSPLLQKIEIAKHAIAGLASLTVADLKIPEVKIGDLAVDPQKWLSELQVVAESVQQRANAGAAHQPPYSPAPSVTATTKPPPIPIPPPIRSVKNVGKPKK